MFIHEWNKHLSYYRGSPGRGSSGQGGAGACWVHGAIFRNIQGSIQIFSVHQRIQVLCLSGWQDVGLDTVNLTQLEVRKVRKWDDAHFALSRHTNSNVPLMCNTEDFVSSIHFVWGWLKDERSRLCQSCIFSSRFMHVMLPSRSLRGAQQQGVCVYRSDGQ